MNAARIRAVVFDMDGVLCRYDFPARLAHMAQSTGVPPETIDEAVFRSGFDELADQGRLSAEAYLAGFASRIGAPIGRAEWLAARAASMRPDPEMLALVADLGRRLDVAMLTNNGPVLRDGLAEVFPELPALFADRAWFSCELGGGKEGTAVFATVLERLGRSGAETLFVDDSAAYVTNARATGLHAHRFTGIAGLRRCLRSFGLA